MNDAVFDLVLGIIVWLASILLIFPFAFALLIAWNHVAPVFDLPTLDYWQSFALLFVVRTLLPMRAIRVSDSR